jgi:polysaccharide chain length determinant protein (PEP-CTERM system associated)
MDSDELKKYLEIVARRIYWIILPFLIVLLAGLYYFLVTPKTYEATTTILVQAQKVPENYVRSTVTTSVQDRLRTIIQQVESRTNLEAIIQTEQLYDTKPEKDLLLEEQVALFKKRITISVANQGGSGESAFSISFQGKDPEKVRKVTDALASNFITENLKIRESQAFGTSDFLTVELESVKNRLIEKEKQLKAYKEKYMGGLPEELDSNLKMLERLQLQLDQLNGKLTAAEEKYTSLQQPVASVGQTNVSAGSVQKISEKDSLSALKADLISLQAKYTESHPDVIQMKNRIAVMEGLQSRPKANENASDEGTEKLSPTSQDNSSNELRSQEADTEKEISRLKSNIKETESQINWYQVKVKETPERTQEMLSMNRDYNNLSNQYNTLLNKELESELSLSMEKKQQGEQFKIIDPAKVPMKPVKPDAVKLFLFILAIGLGTGSGFAYMIEIMDTSYRSSREIEKDFAIPVLMTLPTIYTEMEIVKLKRKKILTAVSVALGFIVCAVGIIFAIKGINVTTSYLKIILDKI